MALTTGLTSFWSLEEASGTRSDAVTASANDLADNNTVTQAVGKVGNAAQFTLANSEYLSRADNASLSTGDIDFTIAAWVYADTFNADYSNPIVAKWGVFGGGDEREYILQWNRATLSFEFGASSDGTDAGTHYAAAAGASLATWYFVVGYHDSVNNVVGLSLNGAAATTTAHTTGVRDSIAAFMIGRGDKGNLFWDGRIDQVGFWKKVLTPAERTQLYNNGNGLTYAQMVGLSSSGTGRTRSRSNRRVMELLNTSRR